MIRLAFCIVTALATVLSSRIALQYFQLESYQLGGYFRALRRNWLRAFLPGSFVTILACAVSGILTGIAFDDWTIWVVLALTLLSALLAYLAQRRLPAKKPLVITARVKRLLCAMLLVVLVISALFIYAAKVLPLTLLLPFTAPLLLALAAIAVLPVEKLIQSMYLRDAMGRLDAMPGLVKIGITGSYGKTSTKFMLEAILSQRFNVLTTPGSFNTSMGVTRIIRERLSPEHQIFIAEMGARHMGDIRLLCKLVRPRYGILTSVGPQHLETFRTQENICREKFELARSIPADGAMVFAADDGLCEGLYQKAASPKHLAGNHAEGLGFTVTDIDVGPWGSRFTLACGEESTRCETRLLGLHNISNLLLACTMARVLGMDMESIARGVAKVQPIEHRLQLLDTANGVTVIDDAFNANPVGANAALDVLKQFEGKRIVVTPGFVELGAEEAKYNHAFGEHMAGCADIAILVGREHTTPIADGLHGAGFDDKNLYIVASLDESSVLLATLLRAGDVVLYENDLPDNYRQ